MPRQSDSSLPPLFPLRSSSSRSTVPIASSGIRSYRIEQFATPYSVDSIIFDRWSRCTLLKSIRSTNDRWSSRYRKFDRSYSSAEIVLSLFLILYFCRVCIKIRDSEHVDSRVPRTHNATVLDVCVFAKQTRSLPVRRASGSHKAICVSRIKSRVHTKRPENSAGLARLGPLSITPCLSPFFPPPFSSGKLAARSETLLSTARCMHGAVNSCECHFNNG